MKKWFHCKKCGKKLVQYEPLMAICYGVYVKCHGCGRIVEIKCRQNTTADDEKNQKST